MSVAEFVRPDLPKGNFRGAQKATRPPPDPLLTETGPGTPCGEYLRTFWWPIGMTEEVPGDLPFRTRLLGEDLVVFKTRRGEYGCLHLNCSHRNTSLEFGHVTECGIRCCYHGWEYAVDGTILDTPGEPANSRIKERVFHGAYPVIEFKGLLFVYMGPQDWMPEFPVYDTFNLADDELVPYSISYPANWLQIAENTTDPYHTVFLHANHSVDHFEESWGERPVIDWYEHENGRHTCNVCTFRWKDNVWVRVYETFFPSFSQVGSFFETAEAQKYFQRAAITKWTVPVDDTTTRITAWRHFGKAIDPDNQGRRELVGKDTVDFLGQTADRPYEERQRIPSDYEAQVGQGLVAVHGTENLGHTDRGVAILRKNLRAGIERVRNGEPPVRPPQNGEEVPSYCSDTIIPMPEVPGGDDEELRRRVSDAVIEVFRSADGMSRGERVAYIEAELAGIKDRPEFARTTLAG